MTFFLALLLVWIGVHNLYGTDAASIAIGAVLLLSTFAREVRNALLYSRALGTADYGEQLDDHEPAPDERGHGGRMGSTWQ